MAVVEITMETGMSVESVDVGDNLLIRYVCSGFPLGLLVMLLVAIAASFASSIKLKNHDNLVNCKENQCLARWYLTNLSL